MSRNTYTHTDIQYTKTATFTDTCKFTTSWHVPTNTPSFSPSLTDVPPWCQPVCRPGLASLQSSPCGQWCTWPTVKAAMDTQTVHAQSLHNAMPLIALFCAKAPSLKNGHTFVSNLFVFSRLGEASSFFPSLVHEASTSSEGRIALKVEDRSSSWCGTSTWCMYCTCIRSAQSRNLRNLWIVLCLGIHTCNLQIAHPKPQTLIPKPYTA